MAGYCTLEVGKNYLKNLDALATDPQNGITQADLTECEEHARQFIDLELGELYDTTGWTTTTPPLVETIAQMLASAEAIVIKFSRDGIAGPNDYASWLEARAKEVLARIKVGAGVLRDASGTVIAPEVTCRPRTKNREERPWSGERWKRDQYSDGR